MLVTGAMKYQGLGLEGIMEPDKEVHNHIMIARGLRTVQGPALQGSYIYVGFVYPKKQCSSA